VRRVFLCVSPTVSPRLSFAPEKSSECDSARRDDDLPERFVARFVRSRPPRATRRFVPRPSTRYLEDASNALNFEVETNRDRYRAIKLPKSEQCSTQRRISEALRNEDAGVPREERRESRLMTNTTITRGNLSSMNRASASFEFRFPERCRSDPAMILRRERLACFNLHARARAHARFLARVMPGITPVYSFTPIPHGALPTYTSAYTRARDNVARVYVYESAFMSRASPCRVLLRNRAAFLSNGGRRRHLRQQRSKGHSRPPTTAAGSTALAHSHGLSKVI